MAEAMKIIIIITINREIGFSGFVSIYSIFFLVWFVCESSIQVYTRITFVSLLKIIGPSVARSLSLPPVHRQFPFPKFPFKIQIYSKIKNNKNHAETYFFMFFVRRTFFAFFFYSYLFILVGE